MSKMTRRAAATGILALPAIRRARADEPIRLRCSLDTAPTHGRNISVADYLKKLEAASDGRIKPELFASGQLFADLNVSKALLQGQVDMAAPGAWTVTNFVQDSDLFQLPALYDQPIEMIHRVTDGKSGAMISAELEQKVRTHILGSWIDNGYSNWFTTKVPLNSLADLKGLKIRNSGGAGQAWRTRFFGAIPNITSWPDVPLALSQGTFDGLITTNDSLVSAQLWEAGVRYAVQDHNSFAAYVPMVSGAFWGKLPPDLQKLMTELWAENIATYRKNQGANQDRARGTLESHGVRFVDLTPAEATDIRNRMLKEQDDVAKELKVSPEIVKLMNQDLG
ncbi:MAG TPA: TRAP transporter substrate-binding protein DctP [Acetobacteraceae bacterium]|jgi:TRAP-type C4-dicarboxylate transport system substrate-binding protein|nr:TRAP transporter substrate-binding protein DctP [Acetobacteraceae bacterium]